MDGHDMLIEWDGSLAAQRRVNAAIPQLLNARSVTLRQHRHASGPLAEDVAAWLVALGIPAQVERRHRPRRSFGIRRGTEPNPSRALESAQRC